MRADFVARERNVDLSDVRCARLLRKEDGVLFVWNVAKRGIQMFKGILLLSAFSLVAMLCGCGGSGSDTEALTAVRGVVRETLMNGETVVIPNVTVNAHLWGTYGDEVEAGGVLTSTTADAEGRFFLQLPPGTYAVGASRQAPDPIPAGCTFPINLVEVRRGEPISNAQISTYDNCH